MANRLIAFLVAACFIMTSPALAVQKVPKKPKQQATQSSQASGKENATKKDKDLRQEPKPSPDKSRRPTPRPERSRVKGKDRFIDEDSDGINDRLKKPPTVKKRKKENRPKKTESRKRPVEKRKKENRPKKTELRKRPR